MWGPTNVGKSSFVESLIDKQNLKYVFMPGVGKFCIQGFNPEVHKVILFEEFDIKFHHISLLKRLMEGRNYAYPVKCEMDRVLSFYGPIIFVSNYNIEECCTDEAFLRRLVIVYARRRHPFWKSPRHPHYKLLRE